VNYSIYSVLPVDVLFSLSALVRRDIQLACQIKSSRCSSRYGTTADRNFCDPASSVAQSAMTSNRLRQPDTSHR